MRVLHFFKTYLPDTIGGIERVINQIARGSARLGIETDVLSLSPKKVPRTVSIDGHRVHRARMDFQIASTGFSASAFLRFSQLAANTDVVHYHFPWPFMDVVHFWARAKKPTVVTYHSDIIRQKLLLRLYRPLQMRFLASVDRIVATSPNYLATSDVLKCFADKVVVIPIGLDKSTYQEATAERLAYWREKLGDRFFLFVGVLRYYKGLHILLDAMKGQEFPVVIVGAGPIESEIRRQAADLGLTNVHILGHMPVEDHVALLNLCYCVVFPSHLRSEAFGITLLEGAMFGKPMISSEIGTGTTYVNLANETGIVVPPADVDALRNAMRTLWHDPELARRMGKAAEQRYWEHFTADKMAEAYVDLYRSITERQPATQTRSQP